MLVPSLQHVATVALACYVSIGLAVPNVQSVTDMKALNERNEAVNSPDVAVKSHQHARAHAHAHARARDRRRQSWFRWPYRLSLLVSKCDLRRGRLRDDLLHHHPDEGPPKQFSFSEKREGVVGTDTIGDVCIAGGTCAPLPI
ncbi:hypothetical protein CGCA056_v010548 [Colletotrichum aenigma]|uniref:uncharacterized protein n=1 Tax=Colletotrichum aenigma TaxID=1215731 RepID=UPI0018729C5F|nr:uncharacterized protein CGCA056_v010548 [Colletotrichum aenigma]KAF5517415.1 hypothetical protein CGCA056_v010548 [Colletotrichum aenigma]